MQGKELWMLFDIIACVCVCLFSGHVKGSVITETTCDFDKSMCGFVQDQNDKFDWSRQKGSTVSSNTGPSADHTGKGGYYMYIETSSPRVRGDNAKLNSPLLTFSGSMCLRFFYHMYGSSVGTLNVIFNDTNTVFSVSGNKGNYWTEAAITTSLSGRYMVTFEGITGSSFTGDIAIDDFSLSSGICPMFFSCNFDESMCGFLQDKTDKFDWTRRKGSTSSSSTGPSADHTGNGGYYMYIETSLPQGLGDHAKLISPLLTFRGNMCLKFFYHMYGSTIGKLNVLINGTKTVFSASGNKGNNWLEARITISLTGIYMVTFEGITGSSFTGDIAIDDFSLSFGTCPPIISCDFDESMCGFVQDKSDKFDWTRRKGSTSSSSTGPIADHTGHGGYYMYIETSSPQGLGDHANLNSPILTFSGNMCLTFFYHMYGSTIGKLNVLINGTKTVFSASGDKGNNWFEARITTSLTGIYMVTFEGITGSSFTGDIAIDDFSLSFGTCPPIISCDFDESMCGFVQDKNDKFDWTRLKGSTSSSSTGPSADHTGHGGYYMYIETSSPQGLSDNAKLNSPLLTFSGHMCLKFFYHMYGSTIGKLNVLINGTKTVFSASGDKGNNWFEARITTSLTGIYMVTFEGITGSSFTGDIAIDDFSLSFGTCPPIISCNFDESMCGFVQDKNDKFDWTRLKGSTSSSSTGPSADHTGHGGYYMYIETSPQGLGDDAKLNSPLLTFSGKMCITFFYHMYGSTIDKLNVLINGTKTVFSASGNKGNNWFEAMITVSLTGIYMVTFEGITGRSFTGDIAIDDFSLSFGTCPPRGNGLSTSVTHQSSHTYQVTETVTLVTTPDSIVGMPDSSTVNPSTSSVRGSLSSEIKTTVLVSRSPRQSFQATFTPALKPSPTTANAVMVDSSTVNPSSPATSRRQIETSGFTSRSSEKIVKATTDFTTMMITSKASVENKESSTVSPSPTRVTHGASSTVVTSRSAPTFPPPATTLAPARQCRVQCSNGKKCRKFGKFLCLCERGRKGINCQEEDLLKEVVDFSLAIKSEDWKPEYLNMNNPTTKKLVARIKKAVTEEIGIGKVIIKSLRKGSVIADVQLTFNKSVGESEVDLLLKETTKDGQFGQFNVDEAVVQFTPIPVKIDLPSSAPTEPSKMNIAFIYGPLIGVLLLVLLLFGIYRVLILKRRNGRKNEEDTRSDAKEACGDSCQNRQVEIQMTTGFNNIGYEDPLQITFSTTKSPVREEGTASDGSSDHLELDES